MANNEIYFNSIELSKETSETLAQSSVKPKLIYKTRLTSESDKPDLPLLEIILPDYKPRRPNTILKALDQYCKSRSVSIQKLNSWRMNNLIEATKIGIHREKGYRKILVNP